MKHMGRSGAVAGGALMMICVVCHFAITEVAPVCLSYNPAHLDVRHLPRGRIVGRLPDWSGICGAPLSAGTSSFGACRIRRMMAKRVMRTRSLAQQGSDFDEAAGAPQLEVVVVGGGITGLFLAISLARLVRGRKHISVYDSRWRREEGKNQMQLHSLQGGPVQTVTLWHSMYASLPEVVQEGLRGAARCVQHWPREAASATERECPWNVDAGELESQLLKAVQDPAYCNSVSLFPMEYSAAENERRSKEEPFHAIVLADGTQAGQARDAVLGEHFASNPAYTALPAEDLLQISFSLPEGGAAGLNLAEVAVMALSQKRYILNPTTARSGCLTLRLAASELQLAEALCQVDPADAANVESSLWSDIELGLKLYGIPVGALRGMSLGKSQLRSRGAYTTQLRDCKTPAEEDIMPHPLAFLLGDAADTTLCWPGREVNSNLLGVRSMVQLLASMQQGLAAGWPVQDALLDEHNGAMMAEQAKQTKIYEKLLLPSASKHRTSRLLAERIEEILQEPTGSRGFSYDDALNVFEQSLRESLAWLLKSSLPPDRRAEATKIDVASLRQRVVEANLPLTTLKILLATGTWVPDPFAKVGNDADASLASAGRPEMRRVQEDDSLAQGGAATEDGGGEAASEGGEDPKTAKESASRFYNEGLRYLKGLQGRQQDDEQAAAWLLKAALRGHMNAQYAIGCLFLDGRGVEQDKRRAGKWFLSAAELGHAKAQYNLGVMLSKGDGIKADRLNAASWLVAAADQGHRLQYRTPDVAVFGDGPWMDLEYQAGETGPLEEAANGGDAYAQIRLGMIYYQGDGVRMDKAKASNYYMQAATYGDHPEAQYQMSCMLFEGDGVEKDEEYAFQFLQRAAKRGHAEAQFNLGTKLYFGEGVGMNKAEAGQLFLAAAQKGLPEAMHNIGWMMLVGDGAQVNWQQGYNWIHKAACNGVDQARRVVQSLQD
eukprot:TRINITY_DN4675_c0_g1_i1.p1 TRINITY_DN4675_c0_g1~~TRINITY_DN4675_c0_g1_i1.p1  ORF type:complete len:948 (-),score=214.29 TRINITY_DN4675_c0_g1_i1:499-3342(-)